MNKKLGSKGKIAIAGCLIVQLCVGIIYLWSIFKSPIAAAFDWPDSAAKMVSSYMLAAFVIGSLLGGILNDKKGPRLTCVLGVAVFSAGIGSSALLTKGTIGLIYVLYAGFGGIGAGLCYSACISCVQKWMPDRKGLASGLAVSAFGLSTVIFAPVARALMSKFSDVSSGIVNFTPVFLILAGIFFFLGSVGCFMIRLPESTSSEVRKSDVTSAERDISLSQAVRTFPFWCIFFTIFFINGTWNLAVPLIYDLGIARGLTASSAILTVSLTGIPNTAGRLIAAAVSDKFGRTETVYMLSAMTVVSAILMIYARSAAYIVVVCVIAFTYGGASPVSAAFCTDHFGAKNSGTNYGVILLSLGLSSLFFNAVSDKLLGGDTTATFAMAACTALIPFLLMFLLHRYGSHARSSASIIPSIALAPERGHSHSRSI